MWRGLSCSFAETAHGSSDYFGWRFTAGKKIELKIVYKISTWCRLFFKFHIWILFYQRFPWSDTSKKSVKIRFNLSDKHKYRSSITSDVSLYNDGCFQKAKTCSIYRWINVGKAREIDNAFRPYYRLVRIFFEVNIWRNYNLFRNQIFLFWIFPYLQLNLLGLSDNSYAA